MDLITGKVKPAKKKMYRKKDIQNDPLHPSIINRQRQKGKSLNQTQKINRCGLDRQIIDNKPVTERTFKFLGLRNV